MMKAAVVEAPNRLVVRNLPEPVPGEYDALCELLYGATCTGTDGHILDGTLPFSGPLPTILGHESVGRVVKVGRRVRHLHPGDLVTRVGAPPAAGCSATWGGFAEFGLARDHWAMAADGRPEAEWGAARVNQVAPAGVAPVVLPMFTTWRETLSYLLRLGVGPGATLLVIGSGGNGLSFATHAGLLGAAAVAMVGAAGRQAVARDRAGVGVYVDYRTDDWAAALHEARPEGFDFVVDAVGRAGIADRALPALRAGGRYGTYGLDEIGAVRINPDRARGAFTVMPVSYDEAETHQQVSDWVRQGRLTPDLWYDPAGAFPLDAIADAFATVRARRSPKALVRLRA